MGKRYHYESLDHGLSLIRVFSLLPASDHSSPLRGHLQVKQFSPTPPIYEAISYVWGGKEREEPLEVNGDELMITPNLSAVLRRVRHQDRRRELWIDAVCIDQSSPEEKSQQVRKMHRIYSLASRVLIWLGEEEPERDIASVMNYVDGLKNEGLKTCNDEGYEIFIHTKRLFDCKWWQRVWTIQEAAVASKSSLVLWGTREIQWVFLIELVEHMNFTHRPSIPYVIFQQPITDFVRVYRQYHMSGTVPLEDLLYISCERYASDARDHVYALLGLVKRQFFEPLEPDYSQSTTWAFQKAIVSVIKARKDLDFLLNIILTRSMVKESKPSSWVYNFADRPVWLTSDRKDYLRQRYCIEHEGATTGRRYCGIQHDAEANTITISGTVVGVVMETQMLYTDCHSELAEKKGWLTIGLIHPYKDPFVPWLLQTVQTFTVIAKEAWSKRFNPETVEAKIKNGDVWRAAMNGRNIDDLKMPDFPPKSETPVDDWAVLQQYSTLEAWRYMLSQENSGLNGSAESDTAKAIYRNIMGCLSALPHWKGCLFTTTNGYVASTDRECQSDDIVCILFGCAMPLVLRPQSDGTYTIVDVAYVEGIMEGEFFHQKAHYEDTNFVIR